MNAYVRSVMSDGSISVTSPVAVTIVPANPAIFAQPGTTNPGHRHGVLTETVIRWAWSRWTAASWPTMWLPSPFRINTYSYTVQATDTLDTVRDA